MPTERRTAILLGRLYRQEEQLSKAIEVLSEVVAARQKEGSGSDVDTADILYNRACYLALMAATRPEPEKSELMQKAEADLKRSIEISPTNRSEAAVDPDMKLLEKVWKTNP